MGILSSEIATEMSTFFTTFYLEALPSMQVIPMMVLLFFLASEMAYKMACVSSPPASVSMITYLQFGSVNYPFGISFRIFILLKLQID